MQLMVDAKRVQGSVYGATDPARDFPEMIRLHVETVRLLQKYSGFCGWVRTLVDRFNALIQSKQFVKPGSRGWNAAAEVNKIRGIIEHYTEQIRDGKVSKIDGEAYLVQGGALRRWTPSGYEEGRRPRGAGAYRVLTPRSIVRALARGYPVDVHLSAHAGGHS